MTSDHSYTVETPPPAEQISQIGKHNWSVARLIALSDDLQVMDIPLAHMNMSEYYDVSLRQMVGHVVAVNNADLDHPILLDEDGNIMDGRHRLMKAILIGAETIKAKRFLVNPSPCKVE